MRIIFKSAPPKSFITYCQEAGASFSSLSKKVKDDLKIALLNEQGWICGYCQQMIKSPEKMTIEHFCEQSICNGKNGTENKTLDYTNLMAVCVGHVGNVLHCDKMKATFKKRLPIKVSPWNSSHMGGIGYTNSGRVNSTNQFHSNEMNDILNLNAEHLRELRSAKMKQIRKLTELPDRRFNIEKMRRLLRKDLDKAANKFPASFPGLSEYMLKKYC